MPTLLSEFNIEFAIIMEPTNLECQLGCLGTLNAELIINGNFWPKKSLRDHSVRRKLSFPILKGADFFFRPRASHPDV